MAQLAATVLGLLIFALLGVNVAHRFELNLQQQSYQATLGQAARQQASFARAVLAYLNANSPASGTVLTVTLLEGAGDLSPGFPETNPFGQTPVAYVGSNKAAVATYAASPAGAYLEPFGLSESSTLNLKSVAYSEAQIISVMQAGYPQLGGSVLFEATFTTPLGALAIPSANDFAATALPAGPIFADLINVIAQPTLSSPSRSGYVAVTGD